jgi:hypothetical protein
VTGPVTALGIRDGDPAVLRALIARRGSAVLAYCERACAAAQVPAAAAEAFARFRALVVAAPRPADLDPEAALLSSTRHAAADRAPHGTAPPSGAGLGRLLGGRPTAEQITLVPDLLIARADGTLDAEGEEQLNRLLDASASARAAEERFRTAEHAYRSAPPRPIPEDIVEQIVDAMSAVPAEAPASPPPPAEPPPPPEAAAEVAPAADDAAPEPPDAAADDATPEPPEAAADDPHDAPPAEPAEEPHDAPPREVADDATPERPDPAAEEPQDVPPPEAVDDVAPEPLDAVVEEPHDAPPSEAADDAAPEPLDAAAEEPEEEVAPADAAESAEDREAATVGARAMEGGEPSVEWDVPPEEIGHDEALDVEIAAARLRPRPNGDDHDDHDDRTGAVAARLQTASGAVDEPLVEETAPIPPIAAPARTRRTAGAAPASASAAAAPPRSGLPGKGALAPAAAVVAVAAVSILATSGVLGGNESQPAVDTGIAPKATQVEVPEGEAATIVDDLRQAADKARRQRLADKRAAAPPPAAVEEEPAPEPAPQDDAAQEDTPAPPQPQGEGDEETPQDATGGNAAQGDQEDAQPAPDETPPADQTQP